MFLDNGFAVSTDLKRSSEGAVLWAGVCAGYVPPPHATTLLDYNTIHKDGTYLSWRRGESVRESVMVVVGTPQVFGSTVLVNERDTRHVKAYTRFFCYN